MAMEDTQLLGLEYQITNRTLNILTDIAEIHERITQSGFSPKIIGSARNEALTKSAHHSTKIEGNPLTLDQVKSLVDGREVIAERHSIDEVKNYVLVLENIDGYTADMPGIRRMHRDISKGVIRNPDASGKVRDVQNYIVKTDERGRQVVVYTPPPPGEVGSMMGELVSWIDKFGEDTHPVILAGICHYAIAMVHPFEDGNGRLARALATLILKKRGFDRRGIYSLDEYYTNDLDAYYGALQQVREQKGDMTQWLEYFTAGVRYSVKRAHETMTALERTAGLNARQKKALKFTIRHGRITNTDYRKVNKVSKVTAARELGEMVEKEALELKGVGRGIHYVIPVRE
jgi:Fic family protein